MVETPHPTLPTVRCISWNSVAVVCVVVRAPTLVREQGIVSHVANHWLQKVVFSYFRDMAGRGM